MQMKSEQVGLQKIVQLRGDLNLVDINLVRSELENVSEFSEIILDLTSVDFTCSALINLLVEIRKKHPNEYSRIKLLNPNEMIMELLEITGLTQLYTVIVRQWELCEA